MMSLPFLILPYSMGVKEMIKVVPSVPCLSSLPDFGMIVNSGSESGVKEATKSANDFFLVRQLETYGSSPVEGALDDDLVVLLRGSRLQHYSVLPSSSSLSHDIEIDGGLERLKRLEFDVVLQGFSGVIQSSI